MKNNANDFIKDKICEILRKYALQDKNDIERVNQNMLYILWLMREQIHNIERNLLQSDKSKDCDLCESSDYSSLKVGEIAKQYLKPLLESKRWSDNDLKSFLDKVDSSKIFGISHSLLSLQRYDIKNRARYYKEQIIVNGEKYFFCSQWNEKPSMAKLVKFINQNKGSVE